MLPRQSLAISLALFAFTAVDAGSARAQGTCVPFPIFDLPSATELSIGSASDGTEYLVAILQDPNNQFGVCRVTTAGAQPIINTGLQSDGGLVAYGGGQYLLIGEDAAGNDIMGQFLNGTTLSSSFYITSTPEFEDPTGVAYDGTNFLVVYFRNDPSGNRTMYARLVDPTGVLLGAELQISPGYIDDNHINNVAWGGSFYLVVWMDMGSPPAVNGRLVPAAVGGALGSPFTIRGSLPSSDPTYPALAFNGAEYLITWNEGVDPQLDIKAQRVDTQGALVGGSITVCSATNRQLAPFIASDGSGYLVTWTDFRNDANFDLACGTGEGSCADVYGRFLDSTGSPSTDAFPIVIDADDQTTSRATFAGSGYLVTWTEGNLLLGSSSTDGVHGKIVTAGGCPLASFCLGDGTFATPCPCANSGAAGRGCANSGGSGAMLAGTGTPSIAGDSLVLSSSGELPTALSIFLQGTLPVSSINFGDGLRCVGGTLKRLYVKNAAGGTATAPASGDLSISSRSAALGDPLSAGSVRYMQTYYRDPSTSFCPAPTGSTYNISSGVVVTWGP